MLRIGFVLRKGQQHHPDAQESWMSSTASSGQNMSRRALLWLPCWQRTALIVPSSQRPFRARRCASEGEYSSFRLHLRPSSMASVKLHHSSPAAEASTTDYEHQNCSCDRASLAILPGCFTSCRRAAIYLRLYHSSFQRPRGVSAFRWMSSSTRRQHLQRVRDGSDANMLPCTLAIASAWAYPPSAYGYEVRPAQSPILHCGTMRSLLGPASTSDMPTCWLASSALCRHTERTSCPPTSAVTT